jgi:hypothetical protein
MHRSYDIFEVYPDGSLLWRAAVEGHEEAVHKLSEMAAGQQNEYRLMHLASKSVIATVSNRESVPS